ncbi:MAG: DUF896 domain-containing protein [Oscillospiraceae bacterium]|nr:DUF896 domain-containing protein [Oscillospiraceae bacterium]
MEQKKIDRINELARKSKTPEGLTEAELAEQKELRAEYIAGFRASLRSQLDGIVVQEADGSRHKLNKKDPVKH